MSYFRFIERNIDVSDILADIQEADWAVAGSLKGAAGDTKPYGFLPLTMAVVNENTKEGGYGNPKNTELQQNTPMYDRYPAIRKWLKSYNLHNHSRATFFRLRPGETLGLHIDEGEYYLTRDRYHLSLQGTYLYTVDGEAQQIEPGTFFWFDNKRPHMSYNNGNVDRLTFVWDAPKRKSNP